MKLSQAIAQLNQLIDEVGDIDLEIACTHPNGGAYRANPEFEFDGQETVVVREAWTEDETATSETMVYVEEAKGYYPLSAVLE